ncbi:cytochrome p450 [Holotrichia oblita]|uniref:Cytochrome p450 n=1 Tax=Holotrichia oblita TaxID=644536 RepID=A0ACB9SLI9_HOLOL|nr:cytochrome p450 [Holotrichia oblita]
MSIIFIIFFIIFAGTYYYFKQSFTYWKKKNVPYLEPTIPFGNLEKPWDIPLNRQVYNYYNIFKKRGDKHAGYFMMAQPVYFPIGPELVNDILVKDGAYFRDRGAYVNEEAQPLEAHLLLLKGEKWSQLRAKLRPTFTPAKLKMMFNTMLDCTIHLQETFEQLAQINEEFEARELISKFTIDVIGSCAFGIKCNAFKDPNSEFLKYAKLLIEDSKTALKTIFCFSFEKLAKRIGFANTSTPVANFFKKVATDTYNYRIQNNVKRNDFMQILIDMKDKTNNPDPLTMNELLAQSLLFFIAGFDTTSQILSMCLFSLATHSDIQEKLREEVKKVLNKYNGEITYDALQDLKYMEQVINETMRMYPATPLIPRECTQDYTIPSTNVVIEKGTKVFIAHWGLQRDPDYFPDPEKFDPDRFSTENKGNIDPGTYIPWGDGARKCLGVPLAMMKMKICVATLLKDFEFRLNPKTKVPLAFVGYGFVVTVKGGIWLNVKKLS